jgi:hypothetical protein
MLNILFVIIIGLIIGLVYNQKKTANKLKEGFGTKRSTKSFFPGSNLMDLKPIDWEYSFDWVKSDPITLEDELEYNPDVKYISRFAHINEIKSKSKITYNPMDASKLYEKKILI